MEILHTLSWFMMSFKSRLKELFDVSVGPSYITPEWMRKTRDDVPHSNQPLSENPVIMAILGGNMGLTEGEIRVVKTFNPASLARVDRIKASSAKLIDEMLEISNNSDDEHTKKWAEKAAEHYEDACYLAVKALTHKHEDADE